MGQGSRERERELPVAWRLNIDDDSTLVSKSTQVLKGMNNVYFYQARNLCAGVGPGAKHSTADNTHLTAWWASKEINRKILIQCYSKITEMGTGQGGCGSKTWELPTQPGIQGR